MNGKFLLDTNIVIALFNNDDLVRNKLIEAREVFISNITVGELYFGAYKSNRVESNIKQIDKFVASNTILNSDSTTAKYYGEVKNKLKIKGKPIPENDIWIASIAIQYDLTLVSRDKHLQEIENLSLQKW
jgi:tRNA(fMet)-specific endonuclease VapC